MSALNVTYVTPHNQKIPNHMQCKCSDCLLLFCWFSSGYKKVEGDDIQKMLHRLTIAHKTIYLRTLSNHKNHSKSVCEKTTMHICVVLLFNVMLHCPFCTKRISAELLFSLIVCRLLKLLHSDAPFRWRWKHFNVRLHSFLSCFERAIRYIEAVANEFV